MGDTSGRSPSGAMYEIEGGESESMSPSHVVARRGLRQAIARTDAAGRAVFVEVRTDTPPLLAEARALVGLAHPSVAPVLDVGEQDGGWFIVRQRWSGPRFDALLRPVPLAPEDVVALLHPVASALDRLHALGVTHCAFCPENLVVSCEEAPRLWVVGVPSGPAFATSSADTEDTQTLSFKATEGLDYVPPDLLESPERPDVYALAVLAFRLLAGGLPFRTYPTLTQTLVARQERAPAGLAQVARRPMLPALEQWIGAALAPDPRRRTPTAAALIAGLERLIGGPSGDHESAVRSLMGAAGGQSRTAVDESDEAAAPELTSVAIEVDALAMGTMAREASIPPPGALAALEDTARTPAVTRLNDARAPRSRSTRMVRSWPFWIGLLMLLVAAGLLARTLGA